MKLKVGIVEDVREQREDLSRIIRGAADLELAGAYPDAESAKRALNQPAWDVAIVDLRLPGKSGLEFIPELKRQWPDCEILVLTVDESAEAAFEAIRLGASGYLLKRHSATRILDAVRELAGGGVPMTPPVARLILKHFRNLANEPAQPASPSFECLTRRENEVLESLSKGFSDKEIAGRLGISSETVNTHLNSIYRKLRVRNRAAAAAAFVAQAGGIGATDSGAPS